VSAPPASIPVVVGEDTNNGFAEGYVPLAWCPHHQRVFLWLLVRTPTTASPNSPLTSHFLRKFKSNIMTDELLAFAVVVMVHDDSVIDIT